MDGDGAGARGGETTPSGALRGEAEATRSGVGAGDTGAGVKRSAGGGSGVRATTGGAATGGAATAGFRTVAVRWAATARASDCSSRPTRCSVRDPTAARRFNDSA